MSRLRERNTVTVRLNGYVDKLLDRLAERLVPRVEAKIEADIKPRIAAEYESWLATIDVATDAALVGDLQEADSEADRDARPYEEIRRELGLA